MSLEEYLTDRFSSISSTQEFKAKWNYAVTKTFMALRNGVERSAY